MQEPSDEGPTGPNYVKREVLSTFQSNTGNKRCIVDIIRYTWNDAMAELAGYPSCIRIRRRYQMFEDGVLKVESCGVPEKDWNALAEVIGKVRV